MRWVSYGRIFLSTCSFLLISLYRCMSNISTRIVLKLRLVPVILPRRQIRTTISMNWCVNFRRTSMIKATQQGSKPNRHRVRRCSHQQHRSLRHRPPVMTTTSNSNNSKDQQQKLLWMTKRQPLTNLSRSRWAYRIKTFSHSISSVKIDLFAYLSFRSLSLSILTNSTAPSQIDVNNSFNLVDLSSLMYLIVNWAVHEAGVSIFMLACSVSIAKKRLIVVISYLHWSVHLWL